ncbi:hypothetical protein KAR91_72985 [Candidatus Pacearchaeota archaeon]|nr:hypothetical protein [Candidatus Pacearchaeota archaeon]
MKRLNEEQIINKVQARINDKYGGRQIRYAEAMDLTAGHLSGILRGDYPLRTAAILDDIGFYRVTETHYVKLKK